MYTVRYCPDVDPQIITHRIVHNPNYGTKMTDVPRTCMVPIQERGRKLNTRTAIKDSIAREGFRNPIIVYATSQGILLAFGGGRLQAAKELDKKMPAIVVDYTGDYVLFEEVLPSNWSRFFRDIPTYFEFTDDGVATHYALERLRGIPPDPAGTAWAEGYPDYKKFILEESPWLGLK